MSLKAKLEAVIYAAEEPVTLAQLAQLFSDEALEQAALPAARSGADPASDYVISDPPPQPDAPVSVAPMESGLQNPATPRVDPPEPAIQDPATGNEGDAPERPPAPEPQPDGTSEPLDASQPELPGLSDGSETDLRQAAKSRDRAVRNSLKKVLDELMADFATSERGVEIREVAGGYRMATKPEHHDAVRGFVKSLKPPMKLSLQALETLAVVAYKQPVTAPEVSEIRGVDSSGALGSLLSRKLVATAGRKQVIGRPILYKTTKEFLLRFGLKDVNELPSIEEFERMAAEITEADEAGATPDEVAAFTAAEQNGTEAVANPVDNGSHAPERFPAIQDAQPSEP